MGITFENHGKPELRLFGEIGRKPRDLSERSVNKFLAAIKAFNSTGSTYLFGEIDSLFGIDPQQFANDLTALGPITELNVYINSPGGSIFDGWTIYNILNQHPAKKNVYVQGLAASIASGIAMAGDTIYVAEAGRMMIHNSSAMMGGEAEDFRQMADLLDSLNDSIAEVYAARSGQSKVTVRAWMDAETWFTGQEAIDAGLADELLLLKRAGDASPTDRAALVNRRFART